MSDFGIRKTILQNTENHHSIVLIYFVIQDLSALFKLLFSFRILDCIDLQQWNLTECLFFV